MDIAYVCIIIKGTIKNFLIKCIEGGEPSYKPKVQGPNKN